MALRNPDSPAVSLDVALHRLRQIRGGWFYHSFPEQVKNYAQLLVLLAISLSDPGFAQAPNSSEHTVGAQQADQSGQDGFMIHSKLGSGPILRNSLSLLLTSGRGCDMTRSR